MNKFTIKDEADNIIVESNRVLDALRELKQLFADKSALSFYVDDRLIFALTPEALTIEPDTKMDLIKLLYAALRYWRERITMTYSFGHPDDKQRHVQAFPELQTAIDGALEEQAEHPWDGLLAVFDDDTNEIVKIVLYGQVYSPE